MTQSNRHKLALRVLAAAAMLLAGAPSLRAQSGFQLVVNAGNALTEITADDASKIFLKQRAEFPNGLPAAPVDQNESAPVRTVFSQAVLGRTTTAVEAYWQRQIFSGRAVPPVAKSSDDEVLDFVRGNLNAIGYVRAGTSVGSGVRVIRLRAR